MDASLDFQAALEAMGFNPVTRVFFTHNGILSSTHLINWMLPKELAAWMSQFARQAFLMSHRTVGMWKIAGDEVVKSQNQMSESRKV
jgi:hypothetical protein